MTTKAIINSACIVLIMSIAIADTGTEPDLKQIMQGLRNDAVSILDGLLIDDFDAVAEASARIAGHPQIPASQVALVAAELGSEMAAFKQFDTLVHDLSLTIGAAAKERNRGQAVAAHRQMIDACLACHVSYRQRVADVLADAGQDPGRGGGI